jgi:hypothetical protein
MSALDRITDSSRTLLHVRKVPVTDFHCPSFSITLRQSDDAGRQIKVRRFGHSQVETLAEHFSPEVAQDGKLAVMT